MPMTAAVVGLGRVGQGYDYDLEDASCVLTHAAAFAAHPGYELVAGVDADPAARERFERKYRKPAFGSVGELHAQVRPEVVGLAAPTSVHRALLGDTLSGSPRAVLCEKPLAPTYADGEAMVQAARASNCTLCVNYMRRFEPAVLDLRERLARGEFGRISKGVGWYSHGFLENGSHLVDLLMFLLEGFRSAEPVGHDPNAGPTDPDVRLEFAETVVYLVRGREAESPLAQLELMGTECAIRYLQGGRAVRTHAVEGDPVFPAARVFAADGQALSTDFARYQLHVVEALRRHLSEGAPLHSDGNSALQTLAVCEGVINAGRSTAFV